MVKTLSGYGLEYEKRISEALSKKISAGECLDHCLRDSNGNKVGFCFAEK